MKRHFASTCLAASMLLGAAVFAVPASADGHADPEAEFDRAFAAYVEENPGDWTGAAELVSRMGGSMVITGADGAITTPAAADAAFDVMSSATSPLLSRPSRVGEAAMPMAWPSNAYTVAVAVVTSGPTDTTVSLAGGWNFRDEFLGQGAPVDIAALMINKSCGTWGTYSSTTRTYTGASTNRGTLRGGGTGTSGPVWNIADYISNHRSYADNGTVSAVYNRKNCTTSERRSIQGEFVYEANDGGSVVSVSAGFGGFSVSYSSSGATMTKSSGAKTVPY